MKRLLPILLVILACAGMLSGCGKKDPTVPAGMKLISNDVVDYTLYVPENWTEDLQNGAISAIYSKTDPSSVAVMQWNLPGGTTTVDAYFEDYQQDFELVFDDFALVSQNKTMFGGQEAMEYVYTGSLGEFDYKFLQVVTFRHQMVYVFTYTAAEELYESHLEDVGSILEHFEFR